MINILNHRKMSSCKGNMGPGAFHRGVPQLSERDYSSLIRSPRGIIKKAHSETDPVSRLKTAKKASLTHKPDVKS